MIEESHPTINGHSIQVVYLRAAQSILNFGEAHDINVTCMTNANIWYVSNHVHIQNLMQIKFIVCVHISCINVIME